MGVFDLVQLAGAFDNSCGHPWMCFWFITQMKWACLTQVVKGRVANSPEIQFNIW